MKRLLLSLWCAILDSHATVPDSGRMHEVQGFSVICARCGRRVNQDIHGRWYVVEEASG